MGSDDRGHADYYGHYANGRGVQASRIVSWLKGGEW